MTPRDRYFFAQDSVIWKISRERVILLYGPATAVMQVAHPAVAAGVAEHSDFRRAPLRRLRHTLTAVYEIVFGTAGEAEQTAKQIAALHAKVRSNDTAYLAYSAADPELIMWVLATLIIGAINGYERFVAPLTVVEKQAYFHDMRRFGTFFGLPEIYGPLTWNDFLHYWSVELQNSSLGTDESAKMVAWQVAQPTTPFYLWPVARPLRFLYSEILPSPVRERLGFRSTIASRATMRLISFLSPRLISLLPGWIRYAKQYRRTQQILVSASPPATPA